MAAEISGYLLTYGVPCGWSLLCLLGLVFNLKYAHEGTIYRMLPVGGFPDDPAGTLHVTFWRTEPMVLRERLKVQAYPRWVGIFFLGLPVVALISGGQPVVALGVLLVIGGISAAVHYWRKSRRQADEHQVRFDLRFGWIWT